MPTPHSTGSLISTVIADPSEYLAKTDFVGWVPDILDKYNNLESKKFLQNSTNMTDYPEVEFFVNKNRLKNIWMTTLLDETEFDDTATKYSPINSYVVGGPHSGIVIPDGRSQLIWATWASAFPMYHKQLTSGGAVGAATILTWTIEYDCSLVFLPLTPPTEEDPDPDGVWHDSFFDFSQFDEFMFANMRGRTINLYNQGVEPAGLTATFDGDHDMLVEMYANAALDPEDQLNASVLQLGQLEIVTHSVYHYEPTISSPTDPDHSGVPHNKVSQLIKLAIIDNRPV